MKRSHQRATLILQVRSGQLTAQQAAQVLGISRQRYYYWEKRALRALLEAMENRDAGRPRSPSNPEKQALAQRVRELEQQLEKLQIKEKLRQRLKDLRVQPCRKKNAR